MFISCDEVGQPFLKLVEGIHDAEAGKADARFSFEISVAGYLIDGAVRSVVVIKTFTHPP